MTLGIPVALPRPSRSPLRARVTLLVGSLLTTLLAGEALLRFVDQRRPSNVAPIYRASGVPGLHYTMVPGLDVHAFGARLETNRLGFRGPDWSRVKQGGTLRIALIGDSHAFGFGVPFDATVGEVLARLLSERLGRPVEVLNFGVNAYNAIQQRSALVHVALRFAPDFVILLPCNNDDEAALYATFDGYLTPRPPAPGDTTPTVPRPDPWRSELLERARRALGSLVAPGAAIGAAVASPSSAVAAETAASSPATRDAVPAVPEHERSVLEVAVGRPLRDMIHAGRAAGARVVLASFAGPIEWRELFQRAAREEQVPLVELLELFPEAPSWDEIQAQFGLGWDPHLGPEAHRRWAVALADVIGQQARTPDERRARRSRSSATPSGGRRA